MRRRLWARRAWGEQCACLEGSVSRRFSLFGAKGRDEPGAVWRSGWVDMTTVVTAPLMLRRELSGGTLDVGYRWIEWCRGSQGWMQLQTERVEVGARRGKEVCAAMPSKLSLMRVAMGNPCKFATSLGLSYCPRDNAANAALIGCRRGCMRGWPGPCAQGAPATSIQVRPPTLALSKH